VLWLADNYLTSITGISRLTRLQQLNLARNDISMIGSSLSANTLLTSINLADNHISNFQVRLQPAAAAHDAAEGQQHPPALPSADC
jgi:Leucine-rich repeat (LRR) protein